MPKIKGLAGFLGLILLSQSDLISLHKQAKWRFIVKVAVAREFQFADATKKITCSFFF